MRLRLLAAGLAAVGTVSAAQSQTLGLLPHDDFESGELKWAHWCPCQIDPREPVTYPFEEGGNRYAQIVVNDYSLGGNVCRTGAPQRECTPPEAAVAAAAFGLVAPPPVPPELPESLGPGFFNEAPESIPPSLLAPPAALEAILVEKNPYCTDDVELRAHRHHEDDECVQRQELRLRKFKPRYSKPYLYSFRVRMPPLEEIKDRKNSIRWVIAQWKEEPVAETYLQNNGAEWGPSPFLALRFDDGVLHVTVQDEECQCLVASAPHPWKEIRGWEPDGQGGSIPPTVDGPPQICESTKASDPPHKSCNAQLTLKYGDQPLLASPLGHWMTMRFRVQASGEKDPPARIDIEQDGHMVVSVTGKIGYEPVVCEGECGPDEEETVTKFKIGHYRDYMPFPATMDIDDFKVETAPN
jgi:hypothetical protein